MVLAVFLRFVVWYTGSYAPHTHLPSGIWCGDRASETLGAVDHDNSSLRSFPELFQQVWTVIRGITTAIGLQHYPLHGWLQEGSNLAKQAIGHTDIGPLTYGQIKQTMF